MGLLRGITCDVVIRFSNVLTYGKVVIKIRRKFNQLTHLNRLSVNGGSIDYDLLLLQDCFEIASRLLRDGKDFVWLEKLGTYSNKFYGDRNKRINEKMKS